MHSDPWYESDLIPLAWDLNAPLLALPGVLVPGDLIKISSGEAALDAVKKSEDGKDLIIRFHEMHGGRTGLKFEFGPGISGWAEADLMEQPLGAWKSVRIVERELYPFEIVTFRVKL